MLRNKIRASLTFRIFCVTCLILLAASMATFGFIAWATPITYTTIVTDELSQKTEELVETLRVTKFEDCGPILDDFVRDQSDVMIVGPDGETAKTPSKLAIQSIYEDEKMSVVTVASDTPDNVEDGLDYSISVQSSDADSVAAVSGSDIPSYLFTFADREGPYTLYVSPRTQAATNQAVLALAQVAPWLLIVMLLFSILCALFYSRYITSPIVRLSAISHQIANLDFSWKCRESRTDEIGMLGRNLDELSARLSAALGELQAANTALQQDIVREREIERQRLAFFSAVSHELKTPVTILKGQLTGMLEGVDVYKDRDKYIAKSLQVTGRMEGLVQEILTVSRMESSGFELNRQTVDLGALVSEQLAFDEDLIAQKELVLKTELPEVVTVCADSALLRKALDNIVSNAVFYAPEGARLHVALRREEGQIALSVENSGSHIPEEALPHVFEAFYRAEGSRNRRTGGSGLGLYIVQIILERHGAAYQIENTQDGVRVTIRFPV